MNEIAPENERITNEEDSNTNNATSENLPVFDKEALNAIVAGVENHSITDEVASDNPFILRHPALIVVAESKNQSIANMAAPDNQSLKEMALENEPITNNAALENHSVFDEEALNAIVARLENLSITDEVASNSPSTPTAISRSSRLGLLSFPPELRVHVFRHLLLEDRPLSAYLPSANYEPFPAILSTCRLIRREALQVLYGENTFYINYLHPRHWSILNDRQIADTIQNVHFNVRLDESSPFMRRLSFIDAIRELGSPAIIRGTLSIIFHRGPFRNYIDTWFLRFLPRFPNFRTVQFEFLNDSNSPEIAGYTESVCPLLCSTYKYGLKRFFGPPHLFANECGLRFHPHEYHNARRPIDTDWADYLDGIRLNMNLDPNEPEASSQDSRFGAQ